MTAPQMPLEALAGVGLASAAVMEIFGIPLQPIVWALIGSVLGAGWAPAAKRWISAIGIYLSASFISALTGHFIAAQWLGASPLAGNAIATGVAIFFHPLLASLAQKVPEFVSGLIGLIGKRGQS